MNDVFSQNPENAMPDAPCAGVIDLAQTFEIERTDGPATIRVLHFPALVGWEMRARHRLFLESKDSNYRSHFAIDVIAFASIIKDDGSEFPLIGRDAINEALECWQNVEKTIEAVLGYNGIKTDAAEVERRRWQVAGEDMAGSFLAAVSSIIGPAMNIAATQGKGDAAN